MASEISLTLTLKCEKGEYKNKYEQFNVTFDQAAQGADSGIVSVGTSEESLTLTDITNNGFCILHNLDDTNYVDWGLNDAGTMKAIGRLEPHETAFFRLKPATSIRMLANSSACKIEYWVLED